MVNFRDSGKVFELQRDPLEMITNKNYNVDLAKLSEKKLKYDFAKELNFDLKAMGKKSTRDRTLIKLPNSSGLMDSASGVSKTIILSSNHYELSDRIIILPQRKQAGNISGIINQENVAIVDKFLEYKCFSKKQHKQLLIKSNLLQE